MLFLIPNQVEFIGLENKLPKGYSPKIKLKIIERNNINECEVLNSGLKLFISDMYFFSPILYFILSYESSFISWSRFSICRDGI